MHRAPLMRSSIFIAVLVTLAGAALGRAARADEQDEDPSAQVRRILSESRADLCRCVERGVDAGHLVAVVMRFEITARGRAMHTEIETAEDVPMSVTRCMKRTVERIRFPEATAFSDVEHKMSFLNTKLDRPRRR
jgi:hypothetical protein